MRSGSDEHHLVDFGFMVITDFYLLFVMRKTHTSSKGFLFVIRLYCNSEKSV